MIMFGVVGLLIAAYIAKTLLAVDEKAPEPSEELIPMAIADIAPGTRLTEAHLGRGPFPKERLEPDMLRTTRVIENRFARTAIRAGQPIRANDLLPPGELPPLKVAEGMRALSVEVGDSAAMLDGMIKAGDYVDVLFTYQGGNDDTYQGGLTLRLFEGVRVLVVSRVGSRGDRGSNHVTLELTEPQANILTLARDRGTITLTYNPNGRGSGGLALSSNERVTLYEILGLKAAEPVEPFLTEIYRGSARSTNRFNDKGRLIDGTTPPAEAERPRRELVPAQPAPAKPTDGNAKERPAPPTASRLLLEPQ
jgi:pilus assembly protein CpaB